MRKSYKASRLFNPSFREMKSPGAVDMLGDFFELLTRINEFGSERETLAKPQYRVWHIGLFKRCNLVCR